MSKIRYKISKEEQSDWRERREIKGIGTEATWLRPDKDPYPEARENPALG